MPQLETSFAFAERTGGGEDRGSLYRTKKESMHTDTSGFEPLVGPKLNQKLLYATGLSFQEGERTVSAVRQCQKANSIALADGQTFVAAFNAASSESATVQAGHSSTVNLNLRESPSPFASDHLRVLLSREERTGEFTAVAPLSPRKLEEVPASFGAPGAAGGPERGAPRPAVDVDAIASEAQDTPESGVESPRPRRASVLGGGYTTYITPTINATRTPEKAKHQLSQFLKATSPRLKKTLEHFERENRKTQESLASFLNGDTNVRSKLALLNTKNPLYQSVAVPFASTFTEPGSHDVEKFDPNSISVRTLEPPSIHQIGDMYKMDKTLTTAHFNGKRDSAFMISNLHTLATAAVQPIDMQSMTDFNAVSNCLKGAARHKPLQRAIEDKQRRRKYLSLGTSKRGYNVSRSVFAQSGSLFVHEK